MCKDDDRVIESLIAQINELEEKLRRYSAPEGIPEGIPEGLNEAEVLAITDIYRYFLHHPQSVCLIYDHENPVRHEIEVSFYDEVNELTKVQNQAVFSIGISGVNYQTDSENYQKIVKFLKKLLKSE